MKEHSVPHAIEKQKNEKIGVTIQGTSPSRAGKRIMSMLGICPNSFNTFRVEYVGSESSTSYLKYECIAAPNGQDSPIFAFYSICSRNLPLDKKLIEQIIEEMPPQSDVYFNIPSYTIQEEARAAGLSYNENVNLLYSNWFSN